MGQEISKPSEETEVYWIHVIPPIKKKSRVERTCYKWFREKAEDYKQSGKIYPRDIYREDLIEPESEPELTLYRIDMEAINRVSEDENLIFLLSGKWLIFIPREQIDQVWDALFSTIEQGNYLTMLRCQLIRRIPTLPVRPMLFVSTHLTICTGQT